MWSPKNSCEGAMIPNTNGHGPKRAILYARVSTQEQAENGYLLAQQIEALRQYAAREGYEVLEEVLDRGQSEMNLAWPGQNSRRSLPCLGLPLHRRPQGLRSGR